MLLNLEVELTDLYTYLDCWLDCWSPRRRQEGVGHDRNSSLISLCNSGTPELVQSGSVMARVGLPKARWSVESSAWCLRR
jgi:hypothetical protein